MHRFTRSTTQNERFFIYYLAVAVFIAMLLLLCPMPEMGRFFRYGMDLLHAPFFSAFAFFLDQKRRARRNENVLHPVLFGVLLCALAVGLEAAQSWAGRHTTWHDGLSNILGVLAGMLFSADYSKERHQRKLVTRLVCILLLISGSIYGVCGVWDTLQAQLKFPVLADFETQNELLRWETKNASLVRSRQYATSGHFSGAVILEHGRYPGVTMELPAGDWSAYQSLNLDIVWPVSDHHAPISQNPNYRFALQIKIEDDGPCDSFKDRFEETLMLRAGRNQIQIPLAKIVDGPVNRSLRLNRMRRLSLFTTESINRQVLFIDGIRLH